MPQSARLLLIVKNLAVMERYTPMLLAAILERAGCEVTFVSAQNHTDSSLARIVRETQPHAYLFSAMTGEHPYLIDLASRLSSVRAVPAIFGGPHATYCPEDLLEKSQVAGVCVGEGDGAVVDLAAALAEGADWTGIANIWVRDEGAFRKNELRPLVGDLDSLPFADRGIVYAEDPVMRSRTTRMFFGMRGCTFGCTYCHNHAFNELCRELGPVVRERSVGNLIEEIQYVRRTYGLHQVHLDDDTFLLHSPRWLDEFACRYPREVGLPFICNVRPELARHDKIRLLAEAGCRTIVMGVECGDERIRSDLLCRNYSNQQVVDAVDCARQFNLRVMLQNLCGLPVADPLAVDEATLQLNVLCKPDWAWSSLFYPYPQTKLGKISVQKGFIDEAAAASQGPETNKSVSMLEWPDKSTRPTVENFHKLFGLVAEYPSLLPLARKLARLPPNIGFELLYYLWYGYCLYARLEVRAPSPVHAAKLATGLLRYLRRTDRSTRSKNPEN